MGTTHATDNYNGALDAFIMCKTLHSQRHADGYDNKRSLPEDQETTESAEILEESAKWAREPS